MKILFVAPYVPSRIRIRPFQIIKGLASRHEVHVVALDESDGTSTVGIDEICDVAADVRIVPHSRSRGFAQALFSLPLPVPLSAAYCWSPRMSRVVANKTRECSFDLVHVEHLRAAHFAPGNPGVPAVFDSVDCLTSLFLQMARSRRGFLSRCVMRFEALKLSYYEPRVLQRFDAVVTTSESERDALLSLNPRIYVTAVPNGVDTEYFAPMGSQRFARRIIFSGKMSYAPNAQAVLWFAKEVFPRVRALWSDAEFVIAGSNPPDSVKALSAVQGIRVTGYLDDLRPELDAASVAVVPMQTAVGIQNKVLEAMAMSLPVVASSLATRAIGPDAPGVIVADTPEDTVDVLNRLFSNSQECAELGQKARAYVRERFSWDAAVNKLESIYSDLLVRNG
ncbi:MAG: glycosyltransferase [Armatimonadota bacterium]